MTTTIQTLSDEVWKPVVGYESICEVSNHGRVRSLDRVVNHSHGGQRRVHGRILEQSADVDGYLLVGLSNRGHQKTFKVHRLVLIAFVGEPVKGAVCMHLDNNPANNRLDNLRWGTQKENHRQRDEQGRANTAKGEAHGLARLAESQVAEIRALYAAGNVTHRELAMRYGVSRRSVGDMINRRTWKHI